MYKDLSAFLSCDAYCDFDNSIISNLSTEITKGCSTDKEKAVAIFYWVRDSILYTLGDWNKKASETISKRKGTCTNSANVFVALCRSINIPAGYGVMTVLGKTYFGPVVLPMMKQLLGEVSTHIYPTVYLDGKWIKIDPSDDYELSLNIQHLTPAATLVEWDGENHAELHIEPKEILTDKCPLSSIVPWMKKNPKNGKGLSSLLLNHYVAFLRSSAKNIRTQKELQSNFVIYLFNSSLFSCGLFLLYYLLFFITSNISLGNKNIWKILKGSING